MMRDFGDVSAAGFHLSARFRNACAAIEAAQRLDPEQVETAEGLLPGEWLRTRRLVAILDEMAPDASEALTLAVHAQHLERWKLPRGDFEAGRAGYRAWHDEQKRRHGERAAEILRAAGYSDDEAQAIASLIRKERLHSNPDSQMLEDIVCVEFMRFRFTEFTKRHDDDRLVDILQKTWVRMSAAGRRLALTADLPQNAKRIVTLALKSCAMRCDGVCILAQANGMGMLPAMRRRGSRSAKPICPMPI